MSEIKTIKGKVLFLCVPTDSDGIYSEEYEEQILTMDSIDDWFHLSSITEEQASLLVEPLTYASSMYDDLDTDVIKPNKTAKESLFSLLKANGCWTKEMRCDFIRAKARAGRPTDILDETEYPDDYLLIIKQ